LDELSAWEGRAVHEWQAQWRLPRLHILANTGSTNDDARMLLEAGAPDGTVVIAERQTAGRGQHGRVWHGVFGKSLHLSTALHHAHPPNAALTAAPIRVGIAVARELSRLTALPVAIKWPNDLVIRGRKTGGILCEGVLGARPFIVIGIGINITHAREDLPGELQTTATSLALEGAAPLTRAQVAGAVLAALQGVRDRIAEPLNTAERHSFDQIDILRGHTVEVDGRVLGTACGIAASGALQIDDGRSASDIRSGPVRIVESAIS
jgi:BirA family transcriptional regulator, biotin operon repressor / biotin---[acetyl-CoA-carboxylase] ligase